MPPPMHRQPSCAHSKQTATAQQNTARGESALYTDSIILSHAAGAELSPELQEAKEAGEEEAVFNLPEAQTASRQSPPGQGNFSA